MSGGATPRPRRRGRRLLALAAAALALLAARPAPAMDRYWTEPAYDAYPLKGAEKALGLVIWNHGVKGHEAQYQSPLPTVALGLAARGWDVIKLNRDPLWEDTWSNAGKRHVARLIEEVAAAPQKGYRRVIVGGQSYGGAIALTAAGEAEGLWAVMATAPSTGQAMVNGEVTDRWSDAIERDTYRELRALKRTRVILVFPRDDPFLRTPRGPTARTILGEKESPFVLVDETAPISGHSGAYTPQFNPYASCIVYFLDPALDPPNREFRCFHDEYAEVNRVIRAANATALAGTGKRWFGYFATSGQEVVLTLPGDGGRGGDSGGGSLEYAWGPGTEAKFKAGAVTVPLIRKAGGALAAQLSNGATISIEPAENGRLRAAYARGTQAPFLATLLPVER